MDMRQATRRLKGIAILALAVTLPAAIVARLHAEDKPAARAEEPGRLAKELIGTWILAGTPENVGEPPVAGGRFKFVTGKHWTISQADPETKKVIYHHGGTYTLDGENYTEAVEYANENTAGMIGQTLKFKITVEGDTYTQVGIGNPYTEAWKRAK